MTNTTTEPSEPMDTATLRRRLGSRLQSERRKKKMRIPQISQSLRIQDTYLKAIESGDWSALPEETYIRGFLRQYAKFLHLDISENMAALKSSHVRLTLPFTMPDPPIAPGRRWAMVSGGVFLLLFLLFNIDNHSEHSTEQALVIQPSPLAVSSSTPKINDMTDTMVQPAATENKNLEMDGAPANQESHISASLGMQSASANTTSTPDHTHHIRFHAVKDRVWLQVFNHQHHLIREALLQAGQFIDIKAYAYSDIVITCGNPVALEIHVDDTLYAASGSLGEKGQILRNKLFILPAKDNAL